jgi:hypothetical protein
MRSLMAHVDDHTHTTTCEEVSLGSHRDEDADSDDEDSVEEGDTLERRMILEDACKLKQMAQFFLHPELPVEVASTASARCFFDRPSAPVCMSQEQVEEERMIMEDLKALKKLAVDFRHPELPVVTTDPTACGRNYFVRASAPEQESLEESEERARILEDAKQLKKLAVGYMHPELPVVTTDPFACGRNYFSRYSAPELESPEEAEERARILVEAKQLKQLAVDFMHPEVPVVTMDPFACGRNYFTRVSAPVQESLEEMEERALILEDAKQLKQLAVDYMHQELPVVTTDPFACGRNFFTRATAPEQESLEESEERARILEDAKHLKQLAVDYMHPELPVVTTDPTACGRNYFARASAPEQESLEESEERARILEDAKQLKQLAVDYMHPELPVVTIDSVACGRNFFTRASAPDQESLEESEERARILEDAKQLKQLAVDYLHPEYPVVTMDPFACGRNFFTRATAPEQESLEESEERARILEDVKQLKQLAVDYMHPELPVATTNAFACGRNFFTRASAPEQESLEEAEERACILEEAKKLKQLAVDYLHPELPVVTTDPTACGRNYFSRASGVGHYGMIHTFPAHEDDLHHDEHHHHEHWDHFHMDEDLDMASYEAPAKFSGGDELYQEFKQQQQQDNEEEGKLSRSPSSVMLFGEEPMYD